MFDNGVNTHLPERVIIPAMGRLTAIISVLVLAVLAAALLLGQPSSAYQAWARYQFFLAAGDFTRAASLVSNSHLEQEDLHRRLALDASEAELVKLDFLDISAVLGIRNAVHAGSLALSVVKTPASKRDFHAALRKALPNQSLQKLALLAAVPLGSSKSTGWVGPVEYGLKTLPFSVAVGLRINFEYQDDQWRIDYFPAMRASAGENEALGGTGSKTDFLARKHYFNVILANENADLQTTMWLPLNSE